MLKDINWISCAALIFYPILLIGLVVTYQINYGIGFYELMILILGYYGSNIAVGVGLHRLWSHNAFKTNKFVEYILVMMTAGTLQGPVLSWASNHYKHHSFTDKDEDPHSPLKFPNNRLLGFLWSHIGWMLIGEGSYKSIDRLTMTKLGRNNLLRWQLKYYWHIAIFMNAILPTIIGYAIGGSIFSAYIWFLFIGIGRAIQQQATFCVNSACHFMGTKKYYKGTAGDIWWLALFLLGENWHNFHHAFPSDYRNGAKWYHFDVHKWIIYAMSKLGLASNLEITPKVRIEAKMLETKNYLLEGREKELSLLNQKIEQLNIHLLEKFKELEDSSSNIRQKFSKSFVDMQNNLSKLTNQIHSSSLELREKSSEKILKMWNSKIKNFEKMSFQLFSKFEKLKSLGSLN